MDWLLNPESWIVFATLTSVEIVLGIDNIVFISILVGKLSVDRQPRARVIGLGLAMVNGGLNGKGSYDYEAVRQLMIYCGKWDDALIEAKGKGLMAKG